MNHYLLNNDSKIKNRLVVAPMTHLGSNEDGVISNEERIYLSNRAGDVGMFITAATLVAEGGKSFVGQPAAISDQDLPSLIEVVNIIKS